MTPVIHKCRIYPDPRVQELIADKVSRLMTLHQQIEFTDFHCWLERRGHTTEKVCELFIHIPGSAISVTRKGASLRRAFLEAVITADRRIKRTMRVTG